MRSAGSSEGMANEACTLIAHVRLLEMIWVTVTSENGAKVLYLPNQHLGSQEAHVAEGVNDDDDIERAEEADVHCPVGPRPIELSFKSLGSEALDHPCGYQQDHGHVQRYPLPQVRERLGRSAHLAREVYGDQEEGTRSRSVSIRIFVLLGYLSARDSRRVTRRRSYPGHQ